MAGVEAMASPIAMDVDKLSYEIFSLLESKFLFGPGTPASPFLRDGRVRVLSVDGCGAGAGDALLAAAALARLEAGLRQRAGDPDARVADFFDLAAGAGAGGVLAAMLFLKGPDGRPRYSAQEALAFVAGSVGKEDWGGRRRGGLAKLFRGGTRKADKSFRRVFGDATLRDTVAPVLVPCYDLATGAPFVFSRADAVESDSFDFRLVDVCAATCAAGGRSPAAVRSLDGRTAIAAASGGVAAMSNPASAAITHVLHNKQEFPLALGMDDILLLSIGTGASSSGTNNGWNTPMPTRSPSRDELARVTAQSVADMVDEAVAMAYFGQGSGSSNYVRVQATSSSGAEAGAMLAQRNVESVLFRGRRLSERTNGEKVDAMAEELVKEQERRMRSPLPNVLIKQLVASPRLSSATTASSDVTATVRTASTMPSPASWDSRCQ
ncbi:patatin-like protein 3 [Brachypodium distachyon]|uniref:Patatin n=1 Tax=Brachypodium distachyon TaxID=15368 RepID=A0A0Q3NB47_BRADI|nr:patatin-like protein 3 [Brachypodium distachyon]KQK14014.1 hypothetical protein BRADI_1g13940v3 [Brachypodium distachyon]|eukprot:XP_010232216.1 patatin-like protein 3 [Brachypodium distachyon]